MSGCLANLGTQAVTDDEAVALGAALASILIALLVVGRAFGSW